jgi:hypothetical protein
MSTSAHGWPALVVTSGEDAGRTITIGAAPVVLGREAKAGIVLPSGVVSRRHAMLRRVDETVTLEDLGSSNGTWVNGVRIGQRTTLELGDLIRVGDIDLQFGRVGFGQPQRDTEGARATYDFGDVEGPVVAGNGNLYAGGSQYIAQGNIHHGNSFDVDVANDYDPWDELWQGKGLGRLLMAVGGIVALIGFGIWMFVIFSSFGIGPTSPTPFERTFAGIPMAALGFAMFAGGGVLAGLGGGMSKAARKHAQRKRS